MGNPTEYIGLTNLQTRPDAQASLGLFLLCSYTTKSVFLTRGPILVVLFYYGMLLKFSITLLCYKGILMIQSIFGILLYLTVPFIHFRQYFLYMRSK